MSRTMFAVAGLFSASSLLLVDSAVKGSVLLMLAAIAATILRRDSAATRHLVWLLAIVAMLAVPALSAMLPQWRVLPDWAGILPKPAVVSISTPTIAGPSDGAIELPQNVEPVDSAGPSDTAHPHAAEATAAEMTAAEPLDSRPALVTPEIVPKPAVWSWIHALPLVWAIGFSVLILRLMAARWMLWNSERRGTVVCSTCQLVKGRPAKATDDPIATALEAARLQLGIGRPVTLLIHPGKTIPVVWGLLRCRLLLPQAARLWSSEQLQSVLLHELAHVRRRDTVAQLLTQFACALHWYNPLVWFAAWRLGAERERACDDLVLASGVRPSAYAGHLLEVVSGLSPARWTQSCGLAMARKSSLEGRLVAVLSEDLNRRGVSVALAAIALAVAIGIAVPVAMLRAADEKWDPPHATHIGGNDFSTYCVHDGKTASFVVAYRGDFGSSADNTQNATSRTWHNAVTLTLKMKDGEKEVAFRQDHTAPETLTLAGKSYDLEKGRVFLISDSGDSIRQLAMSSPAILERADAEILAKRIAATPPQEHEPVAAKRPPQEQEPRKPEEAAKLPGRLFVNAGLRTTKDETRFFQSAIVIDPKTGGWTQLGNLRKSGISVPISPVRVSPDGRTMLFVRDKDIWKCDAATGENPVRVFPKGQPKAWSPDGKEFIAVVEKEPGRSDQTENWRVSAVGQKQSMLSLPISEVVEDWSADGRWLVGWSHADSQLYLVQPDGSGRKRLTNAGSSSSRNEHPRFSPDGRRIVYLQTGHQGDNVRDVRFSLRTIDIDGTDDREILGETRVGSTPNEATWTAPMAARWSPDGKHLAVVLFDHKRDGGILAINGNWRLAIIDADGGNLRELKLQGVLNTVLPWDGPEWRPAVFAQQPKPGAKLQRGAEEKLQWGQPVNGLRAAVAIRHASEKPKSGDLPELYLAVQNVSDAPIRLNDTLAEQQPRMLYIKIDGKTQLGLGLGAKDPRLGDAMLQPRKVAYVLMYSADSKVLDKHTTGQVIAEGALKDTHQSLVAELRIEKAPAGAWIGKLITGETSGAVAAGQPATAK
jgi:beta-lactamase regulating signal transducer with metallopeptidase domain/Tol biopolymer transport system component